MAVFWLALVLAAAEEPPQGIPAPTLVLVQGAPGTPELGLRAARWVDRWQSMAQQGGWECVVIGRSEAGTGGTDREQLQNYMRQLPPSPEPLWIVLTGHGSFDQRTAKLNLRGPDVSSAELATWLKDVQRPLVVINTTAASGPFAKDLAAPGRIVIAATKSGNEVNFAWLGESLSVAMVDNGADFDADGRTSLLEAFLWATQRVEQRYQSLGQISTEHAILEDNGDGFGTRAEGFAGVTATSRLFEGHPTDGRKAARTFFLPDADERTLPIEWRRTRDAMEDELDALKDRKESQPAADYAMELEQLLVRLARHYGRLTAQ